MYKFHKYKSMDLPALKDDEDPCQKQQQRTFKNYQQFVQQYLGYNSLYQSILVYHGLGSGKTVTGIGVYNALFNHFEGWNVFVMIKATLKNDPWIKDLKSWLNKDKMMKNIHFISYDAYNVV